MPIEEFEYEIHEGSAYVGDVQIPLADPKLLFAGSEDGDRSLRFKIAPRDVAVFTRAWEVCVHSLAQQVPGYAVTGVVSPEQSSPSSHEVSSEIAHVDYHDVHYADVHYRDVHYCDIDPLGASIAEIHYADVLYSEVSYADVTYANVKSRELRRDDVDQEPSELMSLTITGSDKDGKRRVINVSSVECIDIGAGDTGTLEIVVKFALALPLRQLLWLVEGK